MVYIQELVEVNQDLSEISRVRIENYKQTNTLFSIIKGFLTVCLVIVQICRLSSNALLN